MKMHQFRGYVTLFSFVAAALLADFSHANLVTIDFDSLTGMSNSPGSSVPSSSQLSDQLLSSDGVVFSSGSSFVAVVNLGAGHATSGVNGIGGTNASGNLSYSSPINAAFFLPASPATLAVTNFVSVRADLIGAGGQITLEAFDIHGDSLATDTQVDLGGPTLEISAAGIHSVRFFSDSNNVAFDDFSFGTLQAVPEPSSLLLVGFAAVGLISRRRRPSK